LSSLTEWRDISEVVASYSAFTSSSVENQIASLVELTAIVVDGSENALIDQEYRSSWEWGTIAAYYHFGIRDSLWSSRDEAREFLKVRAAAKPSPKLFSEHTTPAALELPPVDRETSLSSVMEARRSSRLYVDEPLPQETLGQCLFSGFGIVGVLDDPVLGQVPFKWAPSPGARNAYEAYIYVRRVSGLEPGVYHYAGSTHSLMRLKTHDLPSIGDLLANQDNLDNAAVVIFLVAQFDRPMWKYPHPNGYRTILIEAGHIAQNILLTAAKRGVASLPTCATNDAEVRRFLGLNLVRQAPVHAVVLGVSANSFCDDTVPISMDASVRAEDDDG
jgi:SagB-type dehydrogenase family enzyme